jgi:hypothetical protein
MPKPGFSFSYRLRFRQLLLPALLLFQVGARGQQVISNKTCSLALDATGRLISMKDGISGKEYAPMNNPGALLQVVEDGKAVLPLRAGFQKDRITFYYPNGRTATVKEIVHPSYIRFQLEAISDGIDGVLWGPFNTVIRDTIGGAVGVVRSPGFAIGLQCLNEKTTGGVLANDEGAVFDRGTTATSQSFGSSLQAFTLDRSRDRTITVWGRWPKVPVHAIPDGGLKGSAIAVFACPPRDVLPVIRTITIQEDLPYATWKGEWIKTSRAPGRPYLITTFSESNIDSFLVCAKRMGMAGVYHEDPFETWGHFILKASLFPHGRAGFKACVDKAHAMGLRLGFHTLSNFITTNDAYVTPVPDKGLATAGGDTLAGDIPAEATEIPIQKPILLHPAQRPKQCTDRG